MVRRKKIENYYIEIDYDHTIIHARIEILVYIVKNINTYYYIFKSN